MNATWATRELPILQAVARAEDSGARAGSPELVESTGLAAPDVSVGLQRLVDADYVTAINVTGSGELFNLLEIRLRERGLRELEIWPSGDPFASFVHALDAAIEHATPEDRSRLARVRDSVMSVGRDLFVNILSTAVSTGRLPGS